ncbi:PREDICTED: RING finger protein 186 [Nanorana parkeri]|uniref:RING finger protein 186 n=1 Tax=Nanorana parkeri TaxID=125878 RepID=UPI000854351D|nr:PREDICTED: RING finger protein 186 [Nanorana parkeri]
MGDETGPPGATKGNLGCGRRANTETEMEFGKAREEPQDALPSALTSPPESSGGQQTVNEGSGDLKTSSAKAGTPICCLTDMDCPVCFSRYDLTRLPKELSCGHSFCAVCLKLLVRNEAGTWLIACPICRAPTAVFGGLVCTLQNQELLMSQVQNPEGKVAAPEASRTPEMAVRLDRTGATWISDAESSGGQWTAAKRMVVLLLMLLIVLILVLQFICTGIMKWMLGFALGVVVIITVLLCFNPYWKMRFLGAASQRKEERATSTA